MGNWVAETRQQTRVVVDDVAVMQGDHIAIPHGQEISIGQPAGPSLAVRTGRQTTVLELRVAEDDLGKIIGKQGRTARAVRTLMACAGTKDDKRYLLEILE